MVLLPVKTFYTDGAAPGPLWGDLREKIMMKMRLIYVSRTVTFMGGTRQYMW